MLFRIYPLIVATLLIAGCASETRTLDDVRAEKLAGPDSIDSADDVNADSNGVVNVEDIPRVDEPTPAIPAGATDEGVHIDPKRIVWHIADPEPAVRFADDNIKKYEDMGRANRNADDERELQFYKLMRQHLLEMKRPDQRRIGLEEAIHRALANNYAIRVNSYYPAIDTTKVVEAEAAFDATFYTTFSNVSQNQPVASQLQGSDNKSLSLEGGIRQLMPTGMQVQTSLGLTRQYTSFQYQTINPVYDSKFTVEFSQPLLKGFGLDYNRAQIEVYKNDRRSSNEEFIRNVQDTLNDVEEAYWRLVYARRAVTIQARLLANFEQILDRLDKRKEFDVLLIQISETRARKESARASLIELINQVRNSEDALIALMNDPDIDLADDIELLPTDEPVYTPVVVDRLSEVQAALDNRQEIQEAKIAVDSAKIMVGVAKNQALPQLDLAFSYSVLGQGPNADYAFDEVTRNNYHEYYVGVNFELPVGNRKGRAAEVRSRLQHSQAIAYLKNIFEQVILDVNVKVRDLLTQFNKINPNFESCEASEEQVKSIRARAEAQDFVQLSNELSAIQSLASNRNSLLRSMIEYNIATTNLERAKGTLLDYYGIKVPSIDDRKVEDLTWR